MAAINFGIIGSGGMARAWASKFAEVPAAALVGTWDPDPAQAEGLVNAHGGKVYASEADLLADPAIEAVIVASPNPFHAPQTIAAARAGKHVISEKPMAFTVADCDEEIAVCAEAGVKLMVGQVLRFISPFAGCLQMVRRGDLGKLWGANVTRLGNWRPGPNLTWRGDESWTKGMLWEIYVHEVDFLHCLLGVPTDVCASGGNSYEAFGELGTLRWTKWEPKLYFTRAGETEAEEIDVPQPLEGVAAQLDGFCKALRGEGPIPVTGEEGRAVIATAELIRSVWEVV